MRTPIFFIIALFIGAVVFALALWQANDYTFYAGYVVVQFIVLATAWNILGGYCGYVNFGSAAFFAVGAYSSVAFHKLSIAPDKYFPDSLLPAAQTILPLPMPILILVGGAIAGVIGLGMGYLTLRLRGAFFAIATLALAIVLQTIVLNTDFLGGARGAYIIWAHDFSVGGISLKYVQYLFLTMVVLAVFALTVARLIERSRLGYGFATIRDDELAAEACGVPTLRLKLVATAISGALMGMAGAPFPYYVGYLEPGTAFGLTYGVNAIAMPMIGGTTSWVGPLVGAVIVATAQEWLRVTISSEWGVLFVGAMLVIFVVIAPKGIIGHVRDFLRNREHRKAA